MKSHSQAPFKTTPISTLGHLPSQTRRMTADIEKYQSLLDDPNLGPSERADFLAALWTIILAFIDLGYRVHPVQKIIDVPIGEDMDRAIIRAVEAHWREAA